MAKNNRYMGGEELLAKATKPQEETEEETEEEETYEMSLKEAVSEHERLIKVLRSGDRTALLAEAEIQSKELSKIKG